MSSLEGKVALVTGASRGIGKAVALELASAGAKVALNYRSGEAQAREVAREIMAVPAGSARARRVSHSERFAGTSGGRQILTLAMPETANEASDIVMLAQADVSKNEQAQRLISQVLERWGRIDILVNNAGITRDRSLRKLSEDEWVSVINTDLNSAYFCTSAVIPIMTEQRFGRIVNIASVIGQSGNVGQANYAAAKAGMIALTKSAALELAKFGITVNAVCPGFTATEMVQKIPSEIQDQIKSKIPLGRFAEPREIARGVIFLAIDGDYITGQQLNINGGIYM